MSDDLIPANQSFDGRLSRADLHDMETDVAGCIADLLQALRIERDHNTAGTADRVAKMMVREVFAGRYQPIPDLTDFPNLMPLDQLYCVGRSPSARAARTIWCRSSARPGSACCRANGWSGSASSTG